MQKATSDTKRMPVVALVGRPNVGKSSLFNALLREKRAVVFDEPGTTRDSVSAVVGGEFKYLLVDTAGVEFGVRGDLETNMQKQTKVAMEGADLIVFLVDAQEGTTAVDDDVVQMLRKGKVPFVFVANKTEGKVDLNDFLGFGLGLPVEISALNRIGTGELSERIVSKLKEIGFREGGEVDKRDAVKITFAGRPNVGKSSLINAFLGHERCAVSDVPGTTRDSTEEVFEYEEKKYVLLDTAGVRRRARQGSMIEHFGILRTLEALRRSDVAVLLMDAEEGPTTQDARVAAELAEAGVGVILAFNKIDLLEDWQEEQERLIWELQRQMKFLAWAPVVFISARSKKNIFKLLELAEEVKMRRKGKLDPVRMEQVLMAATLKKPAPSRGKKPPRFTGIEEVVMQGVKTLRIKCTLPDFINFSYRRYLLNRFREEFDLIGVPLRVELEKVGKRK